MADEPGMTYEQLMAFTAAEQLRAVEAANRRRLAAQAAKKTDPADDIPTEVRLLAEQIRGNLSCPARIGDVLDAWARHHDGIERTKQLETRGTGLSALWPDRRPQGAPEPYKVKPFDRSGARQVLLARFPWLAVGHRENPDAIWSAKTAEKMLEIRSGLEDGSISPDSYKLSR
jgi:hypothetical protein